MDQFTSAFLALITMPSITKDRHEQLLAAESKSELVDALQKQLDEVKGPGFGNTLTCTIYLPRTVDEKGKTKEGEEFDKITWSKTGDGNEKVEFQAQLSSYDKLNSETKYGPNWKFQCSDNGVKLASQIRQLIESNDRLVNISCFPRFYESDGRSCFDWMITSVTPRPRAAA